MLSAVFTAILRPAESFFFLSLNAQVGVFFFFIPQMLMKYFWYLGVYIGTMVCVKFFWSWGVLTSGSEGRF